MILYNPYRNTYVEHEVNLNWSQCQYQIRHETPFSERFSEWSVAILDNADMIYIPSGNNRCNNIYIVTWEYTSKQAQYPDGIYTIPNIYLSGV